MEKFDQSYREKFIDSLAGDRLRTWTCQKHSVRINLGSECPLCLLEEKSKERKDEIARINADELKNPNCKIGKKTGRKREMDRSSEEYKEKRRAYMKKWRKKMGKEYFHEVAKRSYEKKKSRLIGHSLFSY